MPNSPRGWSAPPTAATATAARRCTRPKRAREHLLDRLGHELGRERLTGLLREGEDWNEDQAFERAGFGRQAA